ncbi:exodeoxyribonuclease V subunit alpha [uncultured Lamprocystis sp.]|jgi:exodeoxyribonuclease V alpha subunit|uniref:exodeoxyribonuclease V subunit alpha n=1 Tax=uncultured Lamprocystis sp. TaxID=543132 RepID=UPI0025CF776A|nr:exodeoxyribonuclease V subunit alpha [uncultured Lamprocystis sp.]
MTDALYALMEAGRLSPLSYYFARFVARRSGVDEGSVLAQSAALASMRNLQGDVCVDLARYAQQPLFDASGEALATIPRGPDLDTWLHTLAHADWVGVANAHTRLDTPDRPAPIAPLILDGQRLYLGQYWRFEQQVARALRQRMTLIDNLDWPRLAVGLARLFPPNHDEVIPAAVDWQRVAAAIAVSRHFAVISGGPGTGKTTTVVKVLALLLEQDPTLRIALAAPTGKAAARLTEAVRGGKGRVDADPHLLLRVPEEASTIHRLLGLGFDNRARHHRDNPLLIDCLVVDEASMIDLPLMARLLDAMPERARIILLGDRDQLASVEAGNVLGDITGHGQEIRYSPEQVRLLDQVEAASADRLPGGGQPHCASDAVGLLRVSHRFKADSGIGALSRAVNTGQGETALDLFADPRFTDITWLEAGAEGLHPGCVDWAVQRYADYLRQDTVVGALRAFEQTRILAALHQGPFGVDEINRLIERRLQSQGLIQGGDEYQGKPVMVTTNDYEVGLFNGDIGLLWRDENGVLRACFLLTDDQVRSVSVRHLPDHRCAYALTVHKSQGSEFAEVLLVLPFERSQVVTRELIYTGITRAKQRVSIQGNRQTFLAGCRNQVHRSSALAEQLGWTGGG